MSELQAALLVIGIGAIIVVYGFGWWQQRRYRSRFGAAFRTERGDALYQASADPSHAEITEPALDEVLPTIERREISEGGTAAQTPAASLSDLTCAMPASGSDFMIELDLFEPSPASTLNGLWQRRFDFGKPVLVCGKKLNSPHWERVLADGQTLYVRLMVALQLVDRGGAISATKLSDFRDLVLGIAQRINARATVPDHNETLRHAAELDAFCADVDQIIGINLIPPGERALSGGKILQAVSGHGMKLEADGAFHLPDERGNSICSLINHDSKPFAHNNLATFSTPGVTLLLDVPRTEQPAAQFDRMVRIARELAAELQVNVVDDRRVILSDAGLGRIHAQIVGIEEKMCAKHIAPGGVLACRLFS